MLSHRSEISEVKNDFNSPKKCGFCAHIQYFVSSLAPLYLNTTQDNDNQKFCLCTAALNGAYKKSNVYNGALIN